MASADLPQTAADLGALWSQTYPRYKASRDAVRLCADWERGQKQPHLPPKWEAPESFRVQLPFPQTMPLDVASYVSRRTPAPKRVPLGGTASATANRKASKVEEFVAAALESRIKVDGSPLWDSCCSAGTSLGEYAVLVQPAPSHYSGMLAFMDDDGAIRAEWRRNSKGETEDEYIAGGGKRGAYRPSQGRSADAYTEYQAAFKAQRWPIVVRLLSPLEYLPFGRDPETGRLSALLIKTKRSILELRADGFEVFVQGESGPAERVDTKSAGTEMTLYELWSWSPDEGVTVRYECEGIGGRRYDTRRNGEQAFLNLTEEYGLQALPAAQFYGWERASERDPNFRGIPLLFPFLGIFNGAQQTITAEVAHAFLTGFGAWGFKPDKDLLAVWTEMGRPTQLEVNTMTATAVFGEVFPLVHPGSGEPEKVIQLLLGLIERFDLSRDVKGNSDQSGFSQAVSSAAIDTILGSISKGALGAVKFVVECVLEQIACLSRKLEAPIPIYVNVDKSGEVKKHVELSAADLDGDFTIEITQPTKKGQNLALAQSGYAWKEGGAISHRTWLEDFYGDEQPEDEIDRISVERMLESEPVQMQIMALVELMQNDKAAQRLRQMQQEGQVSQGGLPAAALPAPVGPTGMDPMAGGMPMPNAGNPAQSAVAGMMAGPSQTAPQAAVIAATGAPAETSFPGGV